MDFLCMVLDHIGAVFFPACVWLRVIGRLGMPLYVRSVVQGMRFTRDQGAYTGRILLMALVAQVPYVYLFGAERLNFGFMLVLGIMISTCLSEASCRTTMGCLIGAFAFVLALVASCFIEYGVGGLLFFFGCAWGSYALEFVSAFALAARYGSLQVLMLFERYLPDGVRRFRLPGYWRYVLYPGHLVVLAVVKHLVS